MNPAAEAAVAAWNMMGGIEWSALPIVCDVLGISDPELLVRQLLTIRESQKNEQ